MKKKIAGVIALGLSLGVIAAVSFALGARSSEGAEGSDAATRALAIPISEESPEAAKSLTNALDGSISGDGQSEVVRPDPEQPGDPDEGIQVHGNWTIEVSEPDGRLVSRTVFENDLTDRGSVQLAQIWSRTRTAGLWKVELREGTGPSGGGPCETGLNLGNSGPCFLVEPAQSSTGVNLFHTLDVSSLTIGPGPLVPFVARLSGTFTATVDGVIDNVRTRQSSCVPSTAPDSCLSVTQSWNLTEKTISPVTVLDGQQVQVTVDISFS